MVTREFDDTQDYAAYSLETIKGLARSGHSVAYGSTTVQVDVELLNWEIEDVEKCLQSLDADAHYDRTGRYLNEGEYTCWFDVYHMEYETGIGLRDLYIKLSLGPSRVMVHVHSLHPKRYP